MLAKPYWRACSSGAFCGLAVQRQVSAPFDYDGMHFDEGLRTDLLVEVDGHGADPHVGSRDWRLFIPDEGVELPAPHATFQRLRPTLIVLAATGGLKGAHPARSSPTTGHPRLALPTAAGAATPRDACPETHAE
jgi:hypothetical protein